MDKKQAWQIWSQRIPADTSLEQAFYAGFVAGQLSDETKTAVELWQEGVAACKRTGQHNKSVTNEGYCNNCGNPPSVE